MKKNKQKPNDYNSAFKGEIGKDNLKGCIIVIIFGLVLLGLSKIFGF